MGIATRGSSEDVNAIIEAQNRGAVKQEDKLLAALKLAEKQREAQIKFARRMAEAVEKQIVPGVF